MNILGYIIAILILVSIVFQTYYSNWFFDQKIRQSYLGYNLAAKSMQKEYIHRNFEKIPEKKAPSKQKKDDQKKQDRVFKKNELTPICMRLNLEPLLKEVNKSDHFIYQSFVKLISNLYLSDIIDKKDLYPFVDEFLSKLTKKWKTEQDLYFEQIQFSNKSFQRIYYQMLTHENSLLNYIKVKKNDKICLSCSDELLLTSLFNEEIKNRLVQHKQNPFHRIKISKEQLEKWILVYGLDPFSLSFMHCNHPKKNHSEMTITVKDKSTDIVLKQKFPYFPNSSENEG